MRILEARWFRMVNHDIAVQAAGTSRFDGVPADRPAPGTHRLGWVAQHTTAGAALDQQAVLETAVEPPGGVQCADGANPRGRVNRHPSSSISIQPSRTA